MRWGILVTLLATLLGGGLAGSVFTWHMTQPEPTLVTYNVTTTAVRADPTLKSAVPDLKIQVGGEEIVALYTHTVQLGVPRGSHVDRAEVAITFPKAHVRWFGRFGGEPGELRIFGMTSEAPSAVHKIDCDRLPNGARCTIGPLSPGTRGHFAATIAANQGLKPDVVMTGKGVELVSPEELLAREAKSLRSIFTRMTTYVWPAAGLLFGALLSLALLRFRRAS